MDLSLAAKAAHNQDRVQMASALSKGVLRNCKHTPLMGLSHPNWLDGEWQSHANSVQPSCSSSQRGHPFPDRTPFTWAASFGKSSQLLSNRLL